MRKIKKLELKVKKLSDMFGIAYWDEYLDAFGDDTMIPIFRNNYVSNDDILKVLINKLGFELEKNPASSAKWTLKKKEKKPNLDIFPPIAIPSSTFKDLSIEEMNNLQQEKQMTRKLNDTLNAVLEIIVEDFKSNENKKNIKSEGQTGASSKKK